MLMVLVIYKNTYIYFFSGGGVPKMGRLGNLIGFAN